MKKKFYFSLLAVFGFFILNIQSAQATTADELRAMIQQLQQQIAQLQAQLNVAEGGEVRWCYDFNANLRIGDSGADVSALQLALQKQGFLTEINNDGEFDEETASAVVAFQQKHRSEILTPVRLKYGNGFVGKLTRAKLNKLYGCRVTPPAPSPSPTPIPSPVITVLSPNGGEAWTAGQTYDITWTSQNASTVDICIQWSSGGCYYILWGQSAAAGKASWNISATDTYVGHSDIKIRVESVNNRNFYDVSDNYFNILASTTEATTTPSISVVSPNGGETWTMGETKRISWMAINVNYVRIYIEDNAIYGSGSTNYIYDGTISASQGYYDWTIAQNQLPGGGTLPRNYKLRIDGVNTSAVGADVIVRDWSNNSFTVIASSSQATTTVSVGNISLSKDTVSPASAIVSLGKTGVTLGVWRISQPNNVEDLKLTKIQFFNATTSATSSANVKNLKLYCGGVQFGETVASMNGNSAISDTYWATFAVSDTNGCVIPKGGSNQLTLTGDLVDYANSVYQTGGTISPGSDWIQIYVELPSAITGAASEYVIAKGVTSGAYASSTNSSSSANRIYPYRTSLTMSMGCFGSCSGRVRSVVDKVASITLTSANDTNVQFRPWPGSNNHIKIHVSDNVTSAAVGTPFYLMKSDGTQVATGVLDADGTVTLDPYATNSQPVLIAGSAPQTYDLMTNTLTLLSPDAATLLNLSINLGTANLPGDVSWYDQGINASESITWLNGNSPLSVNLIYDAASVTPSKADLSPTTITYSSSSIKAGDSVFFDSGIQNAGGTDTGVFNIKWFIDDVQVGYGSHSGISAITTVLNGNSQYTWTAVEGTHTIKFVVDTDNHVDESNETNNSRAVVLTVATIAISSPSFTVTSPNGGEQWVRGESRNITWASTGSSTTTRISLYKAGNVVSDPSLLLGMFIAVDVSNTGSYNWNIPSALAIGNQYTVRVWDPYYPNNYDDSDNYFAIIASNSESTTSALNIMENQLASIKQAIQWLFEQIKN